MSFRERMRGVAVAVTSETVRGLLPAFVDWVKARLQRGDTPAMIRRDIELDTTEIRANREKADDAFRSKFDEEL